MSKCHRGWLRTTAVLLIAIGQLAAIGVRAGPVGASPENLAAYLHSAAVVPAGGDAAGSAAVTLTADSIVGEVCATVHMPYVPTPMDSVVSTTIRKAAVGSVGPESIQLGGGFDITSPTGTGCTPTLLAAALSDPTSYYIQVDTTAFPDGAIRGQLAAPTGADVAVALAPDAPSVPLSTPVEFHGSVTNHGPGAATSVTLNFGAYTNNRPLSVVTSAGTPGADPFDCTGVTVAEFTCTLTDPLLAGASIPIHLTVSADAPETITYYANIASGGTADYFDGNDTAGSTLDVTGPHSDLAVTTTLDPDQTAVVGSPIFYTIGVTNNGPDTATGALLQHSIPDGWSLRGAPSISGIELTGCAFDDTSSIETCSLPAIAVGATVTLNVALVPNTTNYRSMWSYAYFDAGSTDPDYGNNYSSSQAVHPTGADADLGVVIAHSPANAPRVGEQATYTITVTNSGPDTADRVTVYGRAASPYYRANLDQFTTSQGTCTTPDSGGYFGCDLGTLPPAGTATIVALVTPGTIGSYLNVYAGVFSDAVSDPNSSNDYANDYSQVSGDYASLSVYGYADPPSVHPGGTAGFVFSVWSQGTVAAADTTFTLPLPPGATFVDASVLDHPELDGACTEAAGTVTCALGSIPVYNGITGYLSLVIRFGLAGGEAAGSDVSVTGSVTTTTPGDPNSNDDSTQASVHIASDADLGISVSRSPANAPRLGEQATYTITVTNSGPDAAHRVTVDGGAVTYYSDGNLDGLTTSQGTCTTPGPDGYFSCAIGTVAAGGRVSIVALATPTVAGYLYVYGSVSSDWVSDPNGDNNSASDYNQVTGDYASLSVYGYASPPNVNQGRTARFVFDIYNQGTVAAADSTLTLPLPPGATFVDATIIDHPGLDPACTESAATVSCALGSLPVYGDNAGPLRVAVRFKLDGSESIGANVSVTGTVATTTPGDPIYDNSSAATARIVADSARLQDASMYADASNIGEGSILRWHASVYNVEPGTATNAIMTDTLPAGTTFEGATFNTDGAVSGARSCAITDAATNLLTCQLGDIGGSYSYVEVILSVRVDADVHDPGDVVSNSATFSADQAPSVTTNDSSVTVVADTADLGVYSSLKEGSSPIETGDQPTFDVQVYNNGPSDARNVVLTDTLPAGFTFVSAARADSVAVTCSVDANTNELSCPLGELARYQPVTVEITSRAPSSSANGLRNLAHVTGEQPDTYPSNNSYALDIDVAAHEADIGVSVYGQSISNVGDTVWWNSNLRNAGPGRAHDLRVVESLPAGVSAIQSYESSFEDSAGYHQGACTTDQVARTVTCDYGTVGPGSGYLSTTGHIDGTGLLVNNVAISSSTPEPADASQPNTASFRTAVGDFASLSVFGHASPSSVNQGL